MSIDFADYDAPEEDPIRLSELPLDEPHEVTFDELVEVSSRNLLARVTSELEGSTLWLHSAEFGGQNGFRSLVKAVGGSAANIEGKTVTYTRIFSEKSPTEYAHRWTA